jgi:hypothetical protein
MISISISVLHNQLYRSLFDFLLSCEFFFTRVKCLFENKKKNEIQKITNSRPSMKAYWKSSSSGTASNARDETEFGSFRL